MILMYNNHRKEMSKGFRLTTNNRMELLAVITGLEAITKKELPVIIYSDSQYVVRAVEEGWLKTWMKTNFKGGRKKKEGWKKRGRKQREGKGDKGTKGGGRRRRERVEEKKEAEEANGRLT